MIGKVSGRQRREGGEPATRAGRFSLSSMPSNACAAFGLTDGLGSLRASALRFLMKRDDGE